MADPHAGATPVEVISPQEGDFRTATGMTSTGSPAPAAAMVDTGPGGESTYRPAPPPEAPAPPMSDDEYLDSFKEKPQAKAEKGKKTAKPREQMTDDEYLDSFGKPEQPPAPPPPPPKPPGFWQESLNKLTELTKGLGGATNATASALNTVAAPLVQSANTWYDLLTGKIKSLSDNAPTEWQDAWFKNTVDPSAEHAADFAADKNASFGDKAANALGATIGYLSQAVLTGGAGSEVTATTTGAELAAHGVTAAQAPAITQAVNVGRETYQSTDDPELAFKIAMTSYGFSVLQNAGPISAPGNILTRTTTGAALGAASGEAEREATNAELPDAMTDQEKRKLPDDQLALQNARERAVDNLRQPLDPENAIMNLVQGGLFGAVMGPRNLTERRNMPNGMPEQAQEVPQNIMEHAQLVAANEVKADGGDLLDQTVAAAHVNSVLSAHHDAAAYEGHMEVRRQQVEQENANADAQAEQFAREEAMNRAQAEQAPAVASPDEAFAQREQEEAAAKDRDYTAARNQQGEQEIARGEDLAAGAEKGGANEPGATIADTLSPEQRQAFENLKQRRAAEAPAEPPVAEKLKEQNPEDNFTPYVEPKAESGKPDIATPKPEKSVEPDKEDFEEGESWKTPTGATVEIVKDHGDGTFTIRTTPADSSQLPIRRKVSEAALGAMRDLAQPDEAPKTLADRRAAEQTPPATPAVAESMSAPPSKEGGGSATAEPPSNKVSERLGSFAQRREAEAQGQDILDGMSERGESPRDVSANFFKNTYYKLSAEGQQRIQKYLKNISGLEPGSVLASSRDGNHVYARDWQHIGEEIGKQFPHSADDLEGPDRGLVAIMKRANDQFAEPANGGAARPRARTLADRRNAQVDAEQTTAADVDAAARDSAFHPENEAPTPTPANGDTTKPYDAEATNRLQGNRSDFSVGEEPPPAPSTKETSMGPKASVTNLAERRAAKNVDLREGEAPKGWDSAGADDRPPPPTKAHVEAAVKPVLDSVGPERLSIHDDHTTLPQRILDAAASRNFAPERIRGVYDRTTDTVHLVASSHETADQAVATAVHEIVGHQGIKKLLGDDFVKTMTDIYRNVRDGALPTRMKEAGTGSKAATPKEWITDYVRQHGFDARNPEHQAQAAGEYVAHLAERDVNARDQENPSILRRAIDAVRAGLRKVGIVKTWTDDDIRALLRKSADLVKSEHARDAAAWQGDGPQFSLADDPPNSLPDDHPINVAKKFGKTMEEQANADRGYVKSAIDFARDKLANNIDNGLAFIGLRNLKDFMTKEAMPSLHAFIRDHDQMEGRKGQLMAKAADVARDWSGWISKNKEQAGRLGELMHASTLGGVDPSKDFAYRYTDTARGADPTKAAHDGMRKDLHGVLKREYNKLDDKGKELFNRVRDHYAEHREEIFKALEDRINQSGADEKTKKQLMSELRLRFEAGKVQGPYFPLARFGDHWASAKDAEGNTVAFSRFESLSQKREWIANAKQRGFLTDGGQKMSDKSMMEQINPKFVQKVTELTKEVDPKLADDIWQEYLRAMPEMSMRKHFIHRQGRLGYSMDALRAFAYNSFHGAHQLARLEYGNRLDTRLENIQNEARAIEQKDPTGRDAQWASALAREMGRRYDWIRNPKSSSWSSMLTKFGFGWYLGMAPATAFRIFSQNPMLAAPMLAKYHGAIGATRELSKASLQWAKAKGSSWDGFTNDRSLGDQLRGDERRAFDTANDMNVFSSTNTQALASGGAGDPMYTGAYYHISKVAGAMFNAMEHHNRQTTYLAAYRLGRQQGMSHDDAVNHAMDLTWDSHFDYGNANRPRVLQNDTAKVALLFRQYAWGVTYRLARELNDSFKGETPQIRNAARFAFGGLIGRQLMFSGAVGLPFYWLGAKVLNAMLGDEDRPFDTTAATHAWLEQHIGKFGADAVMTGPAGAATGMSLSGGASYGDLWYRAPQQDMSTGQQITDAIAQLAGPIAAIPLNAGVGLSMFGKGQIERGLEHFVPPEMSALMKAKRYSEEGVQNLKGENVLTKNQISGYDEFVQAMGFTPQKVADAYAQNTAIKNIAQEIKDRRKYIIDRGAVAMTMGDTEKVAEAMEMASKFDNANPGIAINMKSWINSGFNLMKAQAEAVNGVNLPPGLSDLYQTYGSPPAQGAEQ